MPQWNVSKEESGLKLADFIKLKLGNVSLKQIKKSLDLARCKVNDHVEKFGSSKVGFGDSITFELAKEDKKEGSILYEDDSLLIYNKPSRITVEALEKKVQHKLVHRLDRDTTGALLFAKNVEIFENLVDQFKKKEVHKVYRALVEGVPKHPSGVINNYLGKITSWEGQTLWGEVEPSKGLHAVTEWSVLREGKRCAFLECKPITGRTHQIRVHLAGLGHPILGDMQYGQKFQCKYPAPRTLLHAFKLEFKHPKKMTKVSVEAPLPDDFHEAIQILWKSA